MSKALTQEFVVYRAKTNDLRTIRNFNAWGNDLTDLSILEKMPNVEVLSLSVNKISSLRYFKYCKKLQELYLRKNSIKDISEIKHLMDLRDLRALWLAENPLTQTDNYRLIVIKLLPSLMKLDEQNITSEERAAAEELKIKMSDFENQDEEGEEGYAGFIPKPDATQYSTKNGGINDELLHQPEIQNRPKATSSSQRSQQQKEVVQKRSAWDQNDEGVCLQLVILS